MVTMILQENSFDKKYMSLVEIRDFSTVIDNRPFFDHLVKTNKLMKNFRNYQELMIIQEEIYSIICIMKNHWH